MLHNIFYTRVLLLGPVLVETLGSGFLELKWGFHLLTRVGMVKNKAKHATMLVVSECSDKFVIFQHLLTILGRKHEKTCV